MPDQPRPARLPERPPLSAAVDLRAPVTIPRAEYDQLVFEAAAWRWLDRSPHVAELIQEGVEWDRRRTQAEISKAMSGATDWRKEAEWPTYAAITGRRAVIKQPYPGYEPWEPLTNPADAAKLEQILKGSTP